MQLSQIQLVELLPDHSDGQVSIIDQFQQHGQLVLPLLLQEAGESQLKRSYNMDWA